MADLVLNTPHTTQGAMPFDFTTPGEVIGSFDYTLRVSTGAVGSLDYPLQVTTNTYGSLDYTLSVTSSTYGSLDHDLRVVTGTAGSLDYPLQVTSNTYGSLDYTLRVTSYAYGNLDYDLRVVTGTPGSLDYPLQVTSKTYGSLDYTLRVTSNHTYPGLDYVLSVGTLQTGVLNHTLQVSTSSQTRSLDYTLQVKTRSAATALSYALEVTTANNVNNLDYTLRVRTGESHSLDYPLSVGTANRGLAGYIGNSYLPGWYPSRCLLWSAKVLLDNRDVTSTVTGAITITAALNAARLADIRLLPTAGFIRPFDLTAKSIQVWYHIKDSAGNVTASRLRFSGIVDVPSVDLSTGIITLQCTDNLPKRANNMSKTDLKELVIGSSWSSFIFQKPENNWAYVQDLLTTSPSAIFIPPGGNIQAKDLWVDAVTYTANEDTIIDGSLSVSLPSLASIINSIDVNIEITKQELKEQVTSLTWQGEVGPPTGAACGVQQIFDAVNAAGAKFCSEPVVAVPPASRYYTQNFQTVAVINSGEELLCSSISSLVSRRFIQPTTNKITYQVENSQSIAKLGLQFREESYSIPVILDKQTEAWFLQEETVTRWWSTASGLQLEGSTDRNLVQSTDYRPANGGFEPYPAMSATFPIWLSTNPLSSDVRRKKDESHSWTSAGITYDSVSAGSFVIDSTAVTAQGTPAEIEEAILCAQAKARTTIENSHRTATTTFSLIGAGLVELCDCIYVSTSKVETKGIVTNIVETLDIESGQPTTQVTTASSLVQAAGLTTQPGEIGRLEYLLAVTTVPPDYAGNLSDVGAAPYVQVSASSSPPDLTQNVLKQYFYTDQSAIDPEWYGHIAPVDNPNSNGAGQNLFVIPWPTGSDAVEAVINRGHKLSPVIISEDVFQLKYA